MGGATTPTARQRAVVSAADHDEARIELPGNLAQDGAGAPPAYHQRVPYRGRDLRAEFSTEYPPDVGDQLVEELRGVRERR